jgi:hypothetical protein
MKTTFKSLRQKVGYKFWRAKDQNGFIPMIIIIVAILAAVIWVVYTRVAHSKP